MQKSDRLCRRQRHFLVMRTTVVLALGLATLLVGCPAPEETGTPGGGTGGKGPDVGRTGGSGGAKTGGATGSTGGAAGSATGGAGGSTGGTAGGTTGGASGGTAGAGGAGGGNSDAGNSDSGTSADASAPGETGAPPPSTGTGSFKGCPGCVSLFDGKTLTGWHANTEKYDVIMDDRLMKPVMRSTGASRGFLATDKSYENFRLIFSNRLLGGGHAQNMLLWCQRNAGGMYPNNACGGIQYQPPGRSMWDYRPGQNKSPGGKTSVGGSSGASSMDWSQCEILAKGTTGEFRVACCKLTPGQGPCKGVEILKFKDPVSGGGL